MSAFIKMYDSVNLTFRFRKRRGHSFTDELLVDFVDSVVGGGLIVLEFS